MSLVVAKSILTQFYANYTNALSFADLLTKATKIVHILFYKNYQIENKRFLVFLYPMR